MKHISFALPVLALLAASLPAQNKEAIRSATTETLMRWWVKWQKQNADAIKELAGPRLELVAAALLVLLLHLAESRRAQLRLATPAVAARKGAAELDHPAADRELDDLFRRLAAELARRRARR